VLLLNECLLLFISLWTESGKFWLYPRIRSNSLNFNFGNNDTRSLLFGVTEPNAVKSRKVTWESNVSLNTV
jgi:hypothetical protein